ncbi:MAG: tetratricopeptide repeat protein, partial [Bacteroidota bacterium]|nr:tetratricopeptide repeat protein [Bacteroidota bacterium]
MEIRSQILFVFFFIFLSLSYSQKDENTAETIKKAMDYYGRAETLFETGKFRAADSLYILAQEEFQKKEQGEYLISCFMQRARIKFSTGSLNAAADLLDQAEVAFDIYQISHRDSLYSNYLSLTGYYHIISGKLRQAEKAYLEAVEIRLTKQMNDYPLSLMYNNLGFIYDQQGDYIKAEDYFTKTMEVREKFLAPDDIRLASTYINLGGFMAKIEKIKRSREYLELAKEIYIDQFGPDYIELGRVFTNMGVLSYKSGDYNEARDYFLESVRLFSKFPVDYAMEMVSCYNNLGLCEHEEKNNKEALNWYFKSVGLVKWRDPASLGRIYNKIANAYKDLNEELLAEQYFQLSINNAIQNKGNKHLDLASTYMNYGIFLMERKVFSTAFDNFTKALELYLDNYGTKHPSTSRCFHNISEFYRETGHPDSALKYVQEA